jgi:hypothetical protein
VLAVQLAAAVAVAVRHEPPPRVRAPDRSGRLAAAGPLPGRSAALDSARRIVQDSCPGGAPASDESFRADGGFYRLVYSVWVERWPARPRRFVVVLSWRDGSYDYVVTSSAGCR